MTMRLFQVVLLLSAFASSCPGATLTTIMTTNAVDTTGMWWPSPVSTFLPTDARAYVYFTVDDAAVGDSATIAYYSPDGSPVRTGFWRSITSAGNYFFYSSFDIAGTESAKILGKYTVKVNWNGALVGTTNFWIQQPGLSMDQKVFDFEVLASLYAKRYAHSEWKKTLFLYDLFDLSPWLERIRATRADLDYMEILVQYVAALNDAHSTYRIPSTFSADLGFRVDTYFDDGRQNYVVLIDSINRSMLPASDYPFETGDRLLSIDGVKVEDWIGQFGKYMSAPSKHTGLRMAASYLPVRRQSALPTASLVGASATVEIERQSKTVESYTIPWATGGVPLTRIGPVPTPKSKAVNGAGIETDELPSYMQTMMRFRAETHENPVEVLNYGSLTPVWGRPADFNQRLGARASDYFYSGTTTSGGFTIGILRIADFVPSSASAAIKQLETEIAFFQDNTDGLVVDVMRNPGGDPCYGEDVLKRLIPDNWVAMGRRLRPVWQDVSSLQSDLFLSLILGADQSTIDLLQSRYDDLRRAYENGDFLTGSISVCAAGLDRVPAAVVYKKPVLLLTDEFSFSAAESFAAQFQDNQRGKLYGWRTAGAGGSVVSQVLGFYSESGTASVTVTEQCRKEPVSTPDYPSTINVENVGVRPDIWADYMRADTFSQNGKPFVDGFLDAITTEIKRTR